MTSERNDLEVLAPLGREVMLGGKSVTVSPLTVAQLPRFARAIRNVAPHITGDDTDWLGLLAEHGEALIEAAAVATDIDMKDEWIGTLAPDEFLALSSAIFEVNLDFFVRRLAPIFSQAVDRMVAAIAGAGPTLSKP